MKNKGKLTIFLGMAPGVGKTYAMLQAAQTLHQQGEDVLIGYIETHNRSETRALAAVLPQLGRKTVFYQGKSFEELDLEALLQRNPSLALIDELAHTNIPGSLHEKRWQDVETVLESGIDVFTTLNIQHVESRSESVQAVTGVPIFETVPDIILEQADQIRVVDLSPDELILRLRQGKVYVPEKIEKADTHFFKPETLSALRELLLRFTAEKVDLDLQKSASFQTKKTIWNLNERLMVAVSHSPSSKVLIRTARRLAFSLGAPWVAVYVHQGVELSPENREQLSRNLGLAKNLGAEVITTLDSDLITGLKRVAEEKNVSKIVTGRSPHRWWHFVQPSLSEQFIKELPHLDVLVVKTPLGLGKRTSQPFLKLMSAEHPLKGGRITGLLCLSITLVSLLLAPIIGYRAIGFLFLLGILAAGTFASIPVIFASALVSTLTWDILFIPPFGTFAIQQPEDIAMCLTFFGVAFFIGLFSYKITLKETLVRQKEVQTSLLYQTAQCFLQVPDLPTCVNQLNAILQPILSVRITIIPVGEKPSLYFDDKEQAVLDWVFKNHKMAGQTTDTLPLAKNWYLPLMIHDECLGVLCITPLNKQKFLPDEKGSLITLSDHITLYLKKLLLEEKAQAEKLYDLILNCISHELKTPLTSILGNLAMIKQVHFEPHLTPLHEIEKATHRLKKMIDNLLDFSKLNTTHLALRYDWIELNDLITSVLQSFSQYWDTKNITIHIPDSFPLIWGDPILLEHLLENVLGNALHHCPSKTPITLEAKQNNDSIELIITDQGPGIPDEFLETVFEKFFRLPGSKPGGTGLGLAICREIIRHHHGTIHLMNNVPHGTQITITLPHRTPHETP